MAMPPGPAIDSRRRWLAAVLLVAWASVIFTTSCFFIHRDTFIRFIGRGLPDGATRHGWSNLWLYAGLIFVKGYHMAEYALLYCLLFFAARTYLHKSVAQTTRIGIVCCILYAASDEWHQTFVPGRGGTIVDVIIDTTGALLAACLIARRLQ